MMKAKEIREMAKDFLEEYEVVGVRTQDIPFKLGEMNHESFVWIDGVRTDELLEGVCTTDVMSDEIIMHTGDRAFGRHLRSIGRYYGDYVALIGGNSFEYGEDCGELIIKDPVVVKIIK